MMGDTFWFIVFAIGVVQGVFLCVALMLQRGTNRAATGALVLLVATLTAMIFGGILIELLPARLGRLVAFLNINTELALGPAMLLFVRSVLDPQRPWRRRDGLHFLPLVAGLVVWSFVWAVAEEPSNPDEGPFAGFGVELPIYAAGKLAFLIGYVVVAYRTLARGLQEPRRFAAGRRSVALHWLKGWILVGAGLAGISYLVYFAGLGGLELPFESDPFASLVVAVMIYLASLLVLARPWVLSLKARPAAGQGDESDVARLTSYLDEQRPWLDPDLGLQDLAAALGATENRLSALINDGLGTTFYGLLNRYRLAEFERLVQDPGRRRQPVLDLAFEAGFSSKASFYRVFREAHGTTPTAYRASIA